jgi:aryl-alcohol dehydrogenase-like predicted oxidoreductase
VIATKFGWDIDPETGKHHGGLNSRPEHIKRAAEGSLKRLQIESIDLFYLQTLMVKQLILPPTWRDQERLLMIAQSSSRER